MKKLLLLVASFAFVVAACGGGDDTTSELPIADNGDNPATAGACLEGEPDCVDTIVGEPTDLPQADGGDEPTAPAAIPVGDAATASGQVAVAGFVVAVGDEVKLCEALAESFPPQCGGASIPVTSLDQVDPDDLQSEGNVRWTDYHVTLFGEMVDGTLVATPIE
ncbi:MAG: hypothetical protein QNJ77_01890 [Acidimicrobiia bacterium]|nr:hypothetical protein [Acidimicrobiia bacterium]